MSGLARLALIVIVGLLLFAYGLLALNLRDSAGLLFAVLTVGSVLAVGGYLGAREEG